MTLFADWDPEDAYDGDDPPAVRLVVLDRIVADLELRRDDVRTPARRIAARRLLEALALEPGVDQLRVGDLLADLEAI